MFNYGNIYCKYNLERRILKLAKMNLKTWCEKYNRTVMIEEWGGLSGDFSEKTPINNVDYDSSERAIWNCQVCGRTTHLTISERKKQEDPLKCAGCIERERIKNNALKRKDQSAGYKVMLKTIHSSLPEQYIYYYLKQSKLEVLRGVTFDWLGRSSLDIYLPEFKLAIEYDGVYWHYDNNDSLKTKLCLKHVIEVIRVREDALPIKDKSVLIIEYKSNKDYSNIYIPMFKIIDFLRKKNNLLLEYPDVNIKRDKEKIIKLIAEQANKKSIAYIWPEIYDYWDYEKNKDILPEDITRSKNIFLFLKCPHCGRKYEMKPRYYNRSMLYCKCEMNPATYRKYYQYLKDFYNKNGHLKSNENSLLARRALDWIDMIIKLRFYDTMPDDEVEALQEIGIECYHRKPRNYVNTWFRERTELEQKQYDEYFREMEE